MKNENIGKTAHTYQSSRNVRFPELSMKAVEAYPPLLPAADVISADN
jgi:hypothetical protein